MIAVKFSVLLIVALLESPLEAAKGYHDYVHEIEQTFAEQMKNEYNLILEGNSGTMRGKVEEIGLQFFTYRRATIEEARALELCVIDKFLLAINEHEKIQPYLAERPFTYERVTISISFEGYNGSNSDGSIAHIFNVSFMATTPSRNHVVYYSNDPFHDQHVKQLAEPFEEAIKINASSSVNPKIHQPNEYEEEIDNLLASFAEEVWEQYGLERWSIGGKLTHGIEEIGAKFKVYQYVTQDEGRKLIVEVSEKLVAKINSNEKLRPYLKVYPFQTALLKIRLDFEENWHTHFPDVAIKKITLDEDKITYLREVFPLLESGTETYSEAREMVQLDPEKFKRKFPSVFDHIKNWLYTLSHYFMYYLGLMGPLTH